MKILLCLLFPFFLFAQPQYPDSVYMSSGKIYPCLITAVNSSAVTVIYGNKITSMASFAAVDSIFMEQHGYIYKKEIGFIADRDSIDEYIARRNAFWISPKILIDRQPEIETADTEPHQQVEMSNPFMNRWSFGVLYVPYYSGKVYIRLGVNNNNESVIGSQVINETNMEAEAAFAVSERFRLTFSLGYTATSSEEDYQRNLRQTTSSYAEDYGYIQSESIKMLLLNIGAKYYFKSFAGNKVNIFVLGGFGKQFAFVSLDYTNKYPPEIPSTSIQQDNENEYLEQLNSPWHVNLGFGAEYMFNESLSLFSTIEFLYTSVSGKYDYRSVSSDLTNSFSTQRSFTDLVTRVGLGINFYF